MKRLPYSLSLIFLIYGLQSYAQVKTKNLVLITLDGLRWEEVFGGADSNLVTNSEFVKDTAELKQIFWEPSEEARRERLLPFFWTTIMNEGQLYGNRAYNNKMNCTNIFWFSYPGYAEILNGYSDAEHIRSNAKINNPNKTFLEILHEKSEYQGKVGAFTSWDVFPFIINADRSGIPVNSAFDTVSYSHLSEKEAFLNTLLQQVPSPWSTVRLDAFTHHYAKEYIRKNKPKVLYISYGETDDFAHDGRYDHYLKSARQSSAFIQDLWETLQKDPQYRDQTTFVITTDHGRGSYKEGDWKNHGTRSEGSSAIWMAVLGPDTPAMGELKKPGQIWQNQVAATCMQFLGETYTPDKEAGKPIETVIAK